jgi:7-cyano-7-deazaguanine reductase
MGRKMAEIEVFENQYSARDYYITHVNPEYTSVCPKTGLPDFGEITINYIPDKLCLELKALKYYFIDFRDRGIFYESVVNQILDDLVKACRPRYMEIIGKFSTRGGMNSTITAVYDPSKRGSFK